VSLAFFEAPVLALETSCDETCAAVLDGPRILANIVSSQADLHRRWGGVVPEMAARAHVEAILPVIREALDAADCGMDWIGGVAVTNRPGLVGALSVGVTAAKAIAFAHRIPLIGVHHLEGHILSPLADRTAHDAFPMLALVVSGGHTELVDVAGLARYRTLAETIDDAAGEAFDKGARLLGLGYPGGRAVQDAAIGGDPRRYSLPRALPGDDARFSFSGLKTAVLRLVEREGARLCVPDAAAALQVAIVESLAGKTVRALEATGRRALALVGGVAANTSLRATLAQECDRLGVSFFAPPPELCTDNAAMIGLAGSLRLAAGERDGWDLDCRPNAELPS
jgi:N6-L-threonylcarbamoyladenine synthase